jgi:hypothetical protein
MLAARVALCSILLSSACHMAIVSLCTVFLRLLRTIIAPMHPISRRSIRVHPPADHSAPPKHDTEGEYGSCAHRWPHCGERQLRRADCKQQQRADGPHERRRTGGIGVFKRCSCGNGGVAGLKWAAAAAGVLSSYCCMQHKREQQQHCNTTMS